MCSLIKVPAAPRAGIQQGQNEAAVHSLKMTTALQPISGNILSPFVDQENVPSQKQKMIHHSS